MSLMVELLFAGCAAVDDGQHEYAQGWRIGEVRHTGLAAANFPIAGVDCRDAVPTSAKPAQRFASMQFVFDPRGGKYFSSGPKQPACDCSVVRRGRLPGRRSRLREYPRLRPAAILLGKYTATVLNLA